MSDALDREAERLYEEAEDLPEPARSIVKTNSNAARSVSHQQAFQDLSMIEKTVLDFLEDLGEGADSDLKAAINDVEEAVLNG